MNPLNFFEKFDWSDSGESRDIAFEAGSENWLGVELAEPALHRALEFQLGDAVLPEITEITEVAPVGLVDIAEAPSLRVISSADIVQEVQKPAPATLETNGSNVVDINDRLNAARSNIDSLFNGQSNGQAA